MDIQGSRTMTCVDDAEYQAALAEVQANADLENVTTDAAARTISFTFTKTNVPL